MKIFVMDREEIRLRMAADKELRERRLREFWENLKPFTLHTDVPNLPVTAKEEWDGFYVPQLLKAGALPKDTLKDGVWYYGAYRNADFGLWDAEHQVFRILRYKFGWREDVCNHFQDDNGYALFVPLREATDIEVRGEEEKYEKNY